MQPTDTQVQRSLAALRSQAGDVDVDIDASRIHPAIDPHVVAELPEGLVARLCDGPGVRADRLADAQLRLATGEQPSAEDLAGRMVGRLVCDRLR